MTNLWEEVERQRLFYERPLQIHPQTPTKILNQTLAQYSNLPFWLWNVSEQEHRRQWYHARKRGTWCCFNHAIGEPKKGNDDTAHPMYDYEREIYDAILAHKRIWVKKATGLGVTEFMLRFMAWLALARYNEPNKQASIFCVVTGPRIDLAIDLINRLKRLFDKITFEDKNTVVNLGTVKIEAFPSHHLDAMRGLANVRFIFLDEADFFPKSQQQEARTISERYIGKSDAYIAMVSTPNQPGGLFETIEQEQQSLYHKIILGWQRGLGGIYTEQDIANAKRSPSFEREYNLKYLGFVGNVFDADDIEYAIKEEYDIIEYLDDFTNPPRIQGVCGIDPGWGSSNFGIVVTHFIDGHVRVCYANQHSRQDHNEMVSVVWDLIQRFNITKVLVDASAPSFIRALKLQWSERADYENVKKEQREYMLVEPVAFGVEHKQLLYHAKFMLENKYLDIHPSFDKLITSLRSAWAKDGVLDKELTSFDDILDAFRLCLRPYQEKTAEERIIL
jgi:hypothetical protein